MFPDTLILVQRVEYEWPGNRQDTVGFNKKHSVKLIDGDYDIFGDGSVVLLSTPGHRSLLVRLPKTGPVLLSGDAVHFQISFEPRYVSSNNWSKDATLQSVDKIATIKIKEHAQLWFSHDQPQSDKQKKLPSYLRVIPPLFGNPLPVWIEGNERTAGDSLVFSNVAG